MLLFIMPLFFLYARSLFIVMDKTGQVFKEDNLAHHHNVFLQQDPREYSLGKYRNCFVKATRVIEPKG